MKRKYLALFIGALIAIPTAAFASSEDELWSPPQVTSGGYHSVMIGGGFNGNIDQSPLLTSFDSTGESICPAVGNSSCLPADGYNFKSVLPVCQTPQQLDCVVSLVATNSGGKIDQGSFLQYTYSHHPNSYVTDPKYGIPASETPGIWNLTQTPHDAGTQYVVSVREYGNVFINHPRNGLPDNSTLIAEVVPVAQVPTVNNGDNKSNTCSNTTDTNNGMARGIGCDTLDQVAPGQLGTCAFQLQVGGCLVRHAFPINEKFKVQIRLSHEPDAWLDGRLVDPNLSITPTSNGVLLSIEGAPTRVPTFYLGGDFASLPKSAQNYWTTCLAKLTCGFTTVGNNVGNPHTQTNPELRNVQDNVDEVGDLAISTIKTLLPAAGDKSVAEPGLWSIRTLDSNEMRSANRCFSNGPGVKGLVTTNSTTYSEGPPALTNGTLNYIVASPHYNPDGTVFKGNYNLVMRSDVARCLYGFSKAPVSATISVTGGNGVAEVATTVVGESDGWLHLSANNFEFSAPTIRVKLTQAGSKSITCVKGKTVRTVTTATCPSGFKKK